jgi:phosphinothricin acetyltransferase
MNAGREEQTMIREAAPSDAAAIAAIYNRYITETVITFEEEPVSAAEVARRVEEVRSASLPWLVAEEGGQVVGYAYATRWRARSAYRFAAEISVRSWRRGASTR